MSIVAPPVDVVPNTPDVLEWQEALDAEARTRLRELPEFEPIRAALAGRLRDFSVWPPTSSGGRWFQRVVMGGDQTALVVRETPTGTPRVLVDPDELTRQRGRPVSLDWFEPSPDGKLLAYAISEAGTEVWQASLLDVESGRALGASFPWNMAFNVAWLPDSSGFYFVCRDLSDGHHRTPIYRYDIASGVAQLEPVPEGGSFPVPIISRDGRHVVVRTGNAECKLEYLRDADGQWQPFLRDVPGRQQGVFVGDDFIAIVVDDDHPTGRVVRIPLASAADTTTWTELVAPSDDVLIMVDHVGGQLVLGFLRDAAGCLRVVSVDGTPVCDVAVPRDGTVSAFPMGAAHPSLPMFVSGTDEITFVYSTFHRSPSVHRFVPATGELEELAPPEIQIADLVVEHRRAGNVPYSIVRRADVTPGQPRPALIHGYGGFNLAWLPFYLGGYAPFVEAGGTFVLAHLRGGGEFGERWWREGRRERKQRTFDDLYAIAEDLIASGITTPAQLAVQGESNGGLLAGAAVVQRPDLWGAAVVDVPILDAAGLAADPVTYVVAREEYGDPLIPEEAAWLRTWSPVNNVRAGSAYPPTLFIVGQNDPRCPAWHARKLLRLMLDADPGADLLLRAHRDQGHGSTVPEVVVQRTAEWLAFIAHHTGLSV